MVSETLEREERGRPLAAMAPRNKSAACQGLAGRFSGAKRRTGESDRMKRIAIGLALAAAALAAPVLAALPPANAWQIGPVIKGRNYSVNMPLRPTAVRDGLRINFPYPTAAAGHVHYVTFPIGSLEGAERIVMHFRIDAAPGTRFVPQEHPDMPAMLSLFFQQRGDRWTAKGPYETYRWYAPGSKLVELKPGEHTISIDLDDAWISVYGKTPDAAPRGFRDALADTAHIGFVLGSSAARGHGVFATGPASLTITSFEIR